MIKMFISYLLGNIVGIILMSILQINRGDKDE